MKPRVVVQASASVAILVFAVGVWSSGAKLGIGWLDIYSYATTAAVIAFWLWNRFVWFLPMSQRLGLAPRDIRGTWQGTLTSLWTDPESDSQPDPKTAYLVVRQTASTVSAILLTNQAKSVSSLASVRSADGTASLNYFYLSSPDIQHEDHSRMHHGSCSLSITGSKPKRLKGRYWTDRDSRGELDFTIRSSQKVEDFDEAVRLFASVKGSKS